MRLAALLFSRKGPNGHKWRGKYRLVKEVTPDARRLQVSEYQLEEQNMFYLRHPYLTLEQSQGHAKDLQKKDKWRENFRNIRTTYKEPVTLEKHYAHLRYKDVWE
ncbi:hypothetical protein C0J52_20466 [Blattella germanica]|nr:hypothetical protein C0J52_20466 [Blattella germanica]